VTNFPFSKTTSLAFACSFAACVYSSQALAKDQKWLGYSCTFQTECLDTNACADTTFSVDFQQMARPFGDGFGDPLAPPGITKVTTEHSSFSAFANLGTPVEFVVWTGAMENGDMHLFTLAEGLARYTIHMPASGVALYYQGTCEMVAV
jgi:hypothetical protein